MLTFVIPICHPDNANDWPQLKIYLSQLLSSIESQTCTEWQTVIVANTNSDLPELPGNTKVCHVDYPPNQKYDINAYSKEEVYDAVRLDKGRRILTGALAMADTSDYFMYVDCDDLVSNKIAEHVKENSGANGWYVKHGYIWNDGGKLLLRYNKFSRLCGTSLIIKKSSLNLPKSVSLANEDYIKTMYGSHKLCQDGLEKQDLALQALPFDGAIYRVSHSLSHSSSGSFLKEHVFNTYKPHKLIYNILNLRLMGKKITSDFSFN